ncbi:MAG: ATP-binding protein [Ginsengibacter sp.]
MFLESGIENSGATPRKESLQNFLENSPVGIHIADDNGIITFANKAELDLLGYKEGEYVGQPLIRFYQDHDYFDKLYQKLKNEGFLKNQQAKMICKDGSLVDVMISCNFYFEDDKLIHTRCFTRDITEIKKSENLLHLLNRAGEELAATHDTGEALDKIIKLLIPSFTDMVVINELNADGYGNLLKMGHSDPQKMKMAEEYRKNHPINLNHPYKGSVGYSFKTGEPLLIQNFTPEIFNEVNVDDEYVKILKDLSITSVMLVPMQVYGRITGVVSFLSCNPENIYDETDFNFVKSFCNRMALTLENTRLYEEIKKEIEERIEVDKKKDEFISIASHELKTPVTSLKAYTQILQSTFDENKNIQAVEMLSKMDKQVDKLTTLIVDLLDVTKIDKGELMFEMKEFDFNEMVKEIAEEMQRITKSHKIVLDLNHCDPIIGDRTRIGQVIVNFISNAIKYSPGGDQIIIKTSCGNYKVKLSVLDKGIGIPKEEQPNIFRRFFRVPGKSSYTFPGMGLGLYISSEIIRRHDGRIFFESEEGKGSSFSFEINSHS